MGFFSNVNKRKQYLINRPFQLRLMAWMLSISLAPITVFFAGHTYFFWQLKKFGVDLQLPPDHIYFRFIETQAHKYLVFFNVCAVVSTVVVLFLGLILSHQIAGPIHRLKMYFEEATKGSNKTDLTFRKKDFFMELPILVNQFIKSQKSTKKDL